MTRPRPIRVYVDGLNGDIGRPYEWRRGPNHGTFTSTREFRRGGQVCREFTDHHLARRPKAIPAPALPAATWAMAAGASTDA